MTSKPTALGKWGRQTNGQTHKMFFAHNTVWCKPKGAWKAYKAVMQILQSNDKSPIYPELFD
jgi:hypothetical protein